MLTLTHRYRIYPETAQQQTLIEWMEICRGIVLIVDTKPTAM